MKKKPAKRKKWPIIVGVIAIIWILVLIASFSIDSKLPSSKNQIVIIPVSGPITTGGSSPILFGAAGASSTKIVQSLEKANENDNVKGIILEINSPGGTVLASKEIAQAIKKVDKPVVAWIREIGTSGAYWVASASDHIIADQLSITGSIGVISSYLEFSSFLEEYGINYESLTTGDLKELGSPYKELTPRERQVLQSKLDIIHAAFVDEIAQNRNLEQSNVAGLATGVFYLGIEAMDLGLIDQFGGKEEAIEKTKELAGIEKATLVTYKEKKSLLESLGQLTSYPSYYIGRGIGSELYQNMKLEQFNIIA